MPPATVLGIPLLVFTLLHVAISLIGIAAGAVVALEMIRNRWAHLWTAVFLTATLTTSVTGFLFPFTGFKPSYAIGALSILILLIAMTALYVRRLRGDWRVIYVGAALAAFYLNVFVAIVQLFDKAPFLPKSATPGVPGAAALITALAALAVFIFLGLVALVRFRPAAKAPIVPAAANPAAPVDPAPPASDQQPG